MDKELLYKFFEGITSFEEEERIKHWLETSQENKISFFKERKLYDAMLLVGDENEQKILAKSKKSSSQKRKIYLFTTISVASVILLFICNTIFVREASDSVIRYLQVSTTIGETRDILLPDGTKIILNACSSLRYPELFANGERRIELEGEAYVHVTHNEEKPFIVSTSRMNVMVLGTCFDIKSYPEDEVVFVNVENGLVQVDLPEAMVRLKKTECFSYNTSSGKMDKDKNLTGKVAEWREGILSFKSTPLKDVARVLERRYHCKILFAEGQEFDNQISGEYGNASLEGILRAIEYISCVKYIYKKETDEVLFFKE